MAVFPESARLFRGGFSVVSLSSYELARLVEKHAYRIQVQISNIHRQEK